MRTSGKGHWAGDRKQTTLWQIASKDQDVEPETTGRVCLGVELNPAYVDVAVARWQRFTGGAAVLDGDGRTFDEIASGRAEAA